MDNVYINGLPTIAFPPQEGETGEQGNNFVYYTSDVSLKDNDILLNSKNGISEINIIENGCPTQLYQINFSNKPNYSCTLDTSNNVINAKIDNININKILCICAYYNGEKSSEYNNKFSLDTSTNIYKYAYSNGKTYAIYMHYKEKPYKINKYLLGTINT